MDKLNTDNISFDFGWQHFSNLMHTICGVQGDTFFCLWLPTKLHCFMVFLISQMMGAFEYSRKQN